MRVMYDSPLGRIMLIEGHVAVLGQSTLLGTKTIAGRTVRMARGFDYIRFRDGDTGKDLVVREVTTFDNCDGYLQPGQRGRYVVWDAQSKNVGKGALLAIATDGQVVDDVDHLMESLRAGLGLGRRVCWGVMATSIPSLIFWPVVPLVLGCGLFGLTRLAKFKKVLRDMPDRAQLLAYAASVDESKAPMAAT